jgi:hypothetical protein
MISGPLHAPIVGSYLPLLQSMSRPPPLPELNDSRARWAEYSRKRELAQSVLRHLTSEPPLGRHLRMAVRAVLHLAYVSPEAIAIGTAVPIEEGKDVDIFQTNDQQNEEDTRRTFVRGKRHRRSLSAHPQLQVSQIDTTCNIDSNESLGGSGGIIKTRQGGR